MLVGVGGPEREVVTQELHDKGAVLVAVLGHVVQLGNGVLEGRAGHLGCLLGVVQHLAVEHLSEGWFEDEPINNRCSPRHWHKTHRLDSSRTHDIMKIGTT